MVGNILSGLVFTQHQEIARANGLYLESDVTSFIEALTNIGINATQEVHVGEANLYELVVTGAEHIEALTAYCSVNCTEPPQTYWRSRVSAENKSLALSA